MMDAHSEHIWIVALYEQETRVYELLDRLSAIGIDTSEATTLRVEINDEMRAAKFTPMGAPFSITVRSGVTGALIGGTVALFPGIVLYASGSVLLPFVDGLFNHALLSVVCGAIVGAIIGALLGSAKQYRMAQIPSEQIEQVKSDGYLVTVRMPPPLAEQAEEIARGLGAKQILL